MFITLQQHQFSSENIKGTLGIEPGAAGCEANIGIPMSYAVPCFVCLFVSYLWPDRWTNCGKTQREGEHRVAIASDF